MMARTPTLFPSVPTRISRRFVQRLTAFRSASEAKPLASKPSMVSGSSALALSSWAPTLICTSAWLDCAVVVAKKSGLIPLTETDAMIHAQWMLMVPASHAITGLVVLIPLALGITMARGVRRLRRNAGATTPRAPGTGRAAAVVLATILLVNPLLRLDLLHIPAAWLLALGLAIQLSAPSAFQRLARPRLALALLTGSALVFGVWARWETPEHRLARLPAATNAPRRPDNVILLVLDTVRANRTSPHGYHRDTTPQLAKLAERGILFEEARSTAPWTLPAHASMLTGHWPSDTGVTVNRAINPALPTLAEALAAHGYATAGIVANTYYCNAVYGLDRGFADYVDYPENRSMGWRSWARNSRLGRWTLAHLQDAQGRSLDRDPDESGRLTAPRLNQAARDWIARLRAGAIENGSSDRPFFLFLNAFDAHSPYVPLPDQPLRFITEEDLPDDSKGYTLEVIRRARFETRDQPVETRRERIAQATQSLSDLYDECLAGLDDHIGRLVDRLEEAGELERTWIIVTSDHGEHFGEHGGMVAHGVSLYREQIHVPLLIVPPRRAEFFRKLGDLELGSRVALPVSVRDLPQTVLALAGASDSRFPGRSLSRFWDAGLASQATSGWEAEDGFDPVVAEAEYIKAMRHDATALTGKGGLRAIISPERTHIQAEWDQEWLFDLAIDPCEAIDLSDRPEESPALERFRRLGRVLFRRESP